MIAILFLGECMDNKYLAILVVIFIICIGTFMFQLNNNVATFIVINETEIRENGRITGMLMDSFGNGVANKTITFNKPDYKLGTLVSTNTNENGEFVISNVEYLPDAGEDNYYGNFSFAGDNKYNPCFYEGNITVVAS